MNYRFRKVTVALLLFAIIGCDMVFAQGSGSQSDGRDVNAVFSAIPFLRINPDTRTGAMGDVGIATDADPSAIYHNASKLAFVKNDIGLAINYTPWLRELVNDIYIAHLAGYKNIDELQTIGLSLRYFSLGVIQFTDNAGNSNGEYNPNEFAFDLAYARKLSDKFSAGITLKYVRSDLAKGQEIGGSSGNIVKAASAVAADVSFFYKNDITLGSKDAELSLGVALTNIGNKVAYTEDDVKDFIPVNLGIGSNLKINIDEHNSITIAADINKLMVPTPDPQDSLGSYRDKPLLSGMFGSFGDAPNGVKEELQELMYSVGLEYWYNEQFSVRAGYFHEHALKGNRKFLTLGLGLRYSVFGLNFSYIVPTGGAGQHNPLDNTLRFGLTFDFAGNEEG